MNSRGATNETPTCVMRPFFFLILSPVTLKIHGNELKYLQMTLSVCYFVLLTRYWGIVTVLFFCFLFNYAGTQLAN